MVVLMTRGTLWRKIQLKTGTVLKPGGKSCGGEGCCAVQPVDGVCTFDSFESLSSSMLTVQLNLKAVVLFLEMVPGPLRLPNGHRSNSDDFDDSDCHTHVAEGCSN